VRDIKESDWRLLRKLQPVALERFCQRVLSEVQSACSAPAQTNHQRYLRVFATVQDRNEEMARAFDDTRRSNAFTRLAVMRSSDLISAEEFSGFSEETRSLVEVLLGNGAAQQGARSPWCHRPSKRRWSGEVTPWSK
jgi:hypothetical protein